MAARGDAAAQPQAARSSVADDCAAACMGVVSAGSSRLIADAASLRVSQQHIAGQHSAAWAERLRRLWVLLPFLVGILLGLVLPSESGLGSALSERISSVLGWSYFCAWTLSFYPQLVLNYRRKSVRGLSLDFQMLNLVGFSFYFAYNMLLYCSRQLQQEYEHAFGGSSGVRVNDIFFAGHAAAATAVGCLQICVYWDYPPLARSERLLRYVVIAFLAGVISIAAILAMVIYASHEKLLNWLAYISMLAEVKVIISTAKYCPQVWLNIRRQSTKGWSIENIILDFSGGTLSVAQLLWDAWSEKSWNKVAGDPAKLLLGNISMIFDVIFMVQHYCLYGDKPRLEDSPIQSQLLEDVADPNLPRDNQ